MYLMDQTCDWYADVWLSEHIRTYCYYYIVVVVIVVVIVIQIYVIIIIIIIIIIIHMKLFSFQTDCSARYVNMLIWQYVMC